ncbi:hypothetical protein ABH926_003848 [Catenulispora sp. GP43]|uniref:acyl-CoA thioesterase/bile acid-CoA:amino acid N-acyltransferase family protein n=1 Tax=Catenulispora sp. GP43 TaxID=3156263 RepID=UPI00351119CA
MTATLPADAAPRSLDGPELGEQAANTLSAARDVCDAERVRRIRGTAARLLCVLLAVAAAGWLGVRVSDAAGVRLEAGPALETVDLARSVPQQGTYHVADAGGLLWSLQSPDAADPAEYAFTPGHDPGAGPGFGVRVQVLVAGEAVAEQTLFRALPESTRQLDIAQEGLAGSLFLPPQVAAATPAVMVIGGSEGGIPRTEAAAFAAVGYPSLAVGYFGEPGLPACLCSIPLEYFAHAVAWLRTQPGFASRPLVLWGASRGGEGALILASYQPSLFDAVVAVAPSAHINGAFGDGAVKAPSAWTMNGQPLTASRIPVAAIRVPVLLRDPGRQRARRR